MAWTQIPMTQNCVLNRLFKNLKFLFFIKIVFYIFVFLSVKNIFLKIKKYYK